MDLSSALLAGHDSSILGLWHDFRTPVILFLFVALLIFRTWLHLREPKRKTIYSPPPTPPVSEKQALLSEPTKHRSTAAKKVGPRRLVGAVKPKGSVINEKEQQLETIQPVIFYFSVGGSTQHWAQKLQHQLQLSVAARTNENVYLAPLLVDLSEADYDEYFLAVPKVAGTRHFYLILTPSYNIDTALDAYTEHLQETHNDFRIDTAPLSTLAGYAVFGFGDREGWPTEAEGFCSQAKDIDKWLAKLTGKKRAFPLGMADSKTDVAVRLEEWRLGVQDVLRTLSSCGGLGDGVPGSGDAAESDDDDVDEGDEEVLFEAETQTTQARDNSGRMDDLEDLGKIMRNTQVETDSVVQPLAIDFTTSSKKSRTTVTTVVKEMVPKTSPTHTALTKQGYSIIGSHSGVKICRWTKSALRGRGSCYKYSFYGIASHRCMETTPSLSCSNKCVFCWRHGTNPVGTTWRWVVDPPEMIFNGVKEAHYKKIKMLRGVPGVRSERFAEAMQIRHCALSLVGEPIFYPHINEFTAMLHAEHISSFLVCNAQHPDQLATLKPVTQLYVSIDASNRESLRKIDRPLHRDFWERFQRCLDILRQRRFEQRTVFRLTLVKGFNIEDEAEGYADLVEKGLPCFVEVKGVTYCGTSSSAGAGLTMANVPFYEEVCAFVEALVAALKRRKLGYGIAAEHAHSCCILIASDRFRKDGKWHTRIDYDKFFAFLESGDSFTPEDYMGEETPEWATWGQGGFDPRDERVDRKGRPKEVFEKREVVEI